MRAGGEVAARVVVRSVPSRPTFQEEQPASNSVPSTSAPYSGGAKGTFFQNSRSSSWEGREGDAACQRAATQPHVTTHIHVACRPARRLVLGRERHLGEAAAAGQPHRRLLHQQRAKQAFGAAALLPHGARDLEVDGAVPLRAGRPPRGGHDAGDADSRQPRLQRRDVLLPPERLDLLQRGPEHESLGRGH